jgi:scyllo-inositol 2-dehydrogenase (NAD+)
MPNLMERFGEAYRAHMQHFAGCLREGTLPAVGGADALAAFEIGLAATRSAQEGRSVTLAEVRG